MSDVERIFGAENLTFKARLTILMEGSHHNIEDLHLVAEYFKC
jgi:hypothetical protein